MSCSHPPREYPRRQQQHRMVLLRNAAIYWLIALSTMMYGCSGNEDAATVPRITDMDAGLEKPATKGITLPSNLSPVRGAFPKQAHGSTPREIATLARVYAPRRLSLSGCCHILLFYGLGATDLPSIPSGESALKALVDERTAIAFFGKSPFVRTRHGLRYYLSKDPIFHSDVGEAHRDQCLATFAALNLPLDTPITLKRRSYTIADLLNESVAKCSFDQKELAWSVIAYAKYLPPQKEWANCFGERMSFSQLVEQLIGRDLDKESCAGTHVIQALVQIDNMDHEHFVLDEKARKKLDAYLTDALHDVVRRQREDGSWDWEWSGSIHDTSSLTPFQKKFLVTGHLLEVLIAVDSQRRPPDVVYVRATRWLQRSLNSAEIRRDGTFICPFTHAARAVRDFVSSSVAQP